MCLRSSADLITVAWMWCRAVVVLGLPYPNAADPELAARMAFLDQQRSALSSPPNGPKQCPAHRPSGRAQGSVSEGAQAGFSGSPPWQGGVTPGSMSPGRQYYEDLCMKVSKPAPLLRAGCKCEGCRMSILRVRLCLSR